MKILLITFLLSLLPTSKTDQFELWTMTIDVQYKQISKLRDKYQVDYDKKSITSDQYLIKSSFAEGYLAALEGQREIIKSLR